MRFDGSLGGRCEFIIEIGGDVASSLPATYRLGQTGGALGIPLRECTHEHHPPPAKALFGGRQADPECLGDGRYGPAYGIVEDDHRPVAGRQPDEGILDLVALRL